MKGGWERFGALGWPLIWGLLKVQQQDQYYFSAIIFFLFSDDDEAHVSYIFKNTNLIKINAPLFFYADFFSICDVKYFHDLERCRKYEKGLYIYQ